MIFIAIGYYIMIYGLFSIFIFYKERKLIRLIQTVVFLISGYSIYKMNNMYTPLYIYMIYCLLFIVLIITVTYDLLNKYIFTFKK